MDGLGSLLVLIIYLMALIIVGTMTYLAWFRFEVLHDLLLKINGLTKPDDELYSYNEFRRWLLSHPSGKWMTRIGYTLLTIVCGAVGIAVIMAAARN